MDYKIFDDFKRVQPVPYAKIIAYKDKLPKELLSVWEELGYGAFMGGYLKIVDPAVYQRILEESYF